MWVKHKLSSGRPDIKFQYKALARFSDGAAMEPATICTTDTATNQLLGARMGICNLQVLSEDLDLDGQQDRIRVEVGIVNMERVTSVALLLEFYYKLKAAADVHLKGVAHVEYDSPGPGSELHTSGVLKLQQGKLLTAGSSFVDTENVLLRYNSTDPYELGPFATIDIPKIIRQQHGRDMSLAFEQITQTWKAGIGPFKAVVDIAVPRVQPLMYRPRALSEIKIGFIQWLALFVAFAYLFSVFEACLFQRRAFDTFCLWDKVDAGSQTGF